MICDLTLDPLRCPTKWELWQQAISLLPPGRAWQTRDSLESYGVTFDEAGDPEIDSLTRLMQYWAAWAELLEELHNAACALPDEFFCSTATRTIDEWYTEWGYPDDCEAYDDLCEKVTAIPGASCAEYVDLAARRGWSITCNDVYYPPSGPIQADCFQADCDRADRGAMPARRVLTIHVDLAASSAYTTDFKLPQADCMMADCSRLADQPQIGQVKCLIERIRPAHQLVYYSAS